MNEINTGGTAFPYGTAYPGMTLRDYFAAKAMGAMILGTSMWRDGEDEDLAKCAYEVADAMLQVREQ